MAKKKQPDPADLRQLAELAGRCRNMFHEAEQLVAAVNQLLGRLDVEDKLEKRAQEASGPVLAGLTDIRFVLDLLKKELPVE
jgi:hypothetical protein